MAYIYQADVWCDDCGRAICKRLKREGSRAIVYPEHAGDDEEADMPRHCAAEEHCVNAITLPSGEKVGYLFGELTTVGVEYVKEAVADAATVPKCGKLIGYYELIDLWQQHYRDKGYNV